MTENLTTLIDELGINKAKQAVLAAREKEIKDKLATEHGVGAYSGLLFDATVSYAQRGTLDMQAVRRKLSAQFIRANTRFSSVWTVRVVGRVADRKVA